MAFGDADRMVFLEPGETQDRGARQAGVADVPGPISSVRAEGVPLPTAW